MTPGDLSDLATKAFEGKGPEVGVVVALLNTGSVLIAFRERDLSGNLALRLSLHQAASLCQMIAAVLPAQGSELVN